MKGNQLWKYREVRGDTWPAGVFGNGVVPHCFFNKTHHSLVPQTCHARFSMHSGEARNPYFYVKSPVLNIGSRVLLEIKKAKPHQENQQNLTGGRQC
jgi:hypothetical protein